MFKLEIMKNFPGNQSNKGITTQENDGLTWLAILIYLLFLVQLPMALYGDSNLTCR